MKVDFEDYKTTLKEIHKKAKEYDATLNSCSTATLQAILDVFEIKDLFLLKAATGLSGGIARSSSVCGAFLGGVMAFGVVAGILCDKKTDEYEKDLVIEMTQSLRQLFIHEYNTEEHITCDEIQLCIFGRTFDKLDSKEREEMKEVNTDDKCPEICGRAARWAGQIILTYLDKLK